MKAMMDKPHPVRFDEKLSNDSVLEWKRNAMPRSKIAQAMPVLLILFVLLAVIELVFAR